MRVDRTRVAFEVSFNWRGHVHYVALHDLKYVEAETLTDDRPVDRRSGARGRLTFRIRPDAGVWGWSRLANYEQSFTRQLEFKLFRIEIERRATAGRYFPLLAAVFHECGVGIHSSEAEYIEANLVRDISLDDLAKPAGLSRFHFSRAFKRTTQFAPYHFLLRPRIERATLLLKQNRMSVGEIAAAVGFKDSSGFIRTFHRVAGVTPGQVRRKKRTLHL